jgi:hypothetical protein
MLEQKYKLLFRDIDVGVIRQQNVDFPNLWGQFEMSCNEDCPETRAHIQRYIEYSREADRLMLQDDKPGSEWDVFRSQNETKFVNLIESEDWWLVDEHGMRHAILIPRFCVDGVVWRWNVAVDREKR